MHAADGTPTIDCFNISPPRSGNTWVSWCLDAHPSVSVLRPAHPGPYKTPEIFPNTRDLPFVGLLSDYRERLAHAKTGDILVDASTYQLLDADRAAPRILEHNPHARLLAVLRHPIDRLFDHYRAARHAHQPILVPSTFEEALDVPAFLDTSRYASHLAAWSDHFDDDQMHIILDTDLLHDTERVLHETYTFLGVNHRFRPEGDLEAGEAFRAPTTRRRRRLPEAYRSIVRRQRDTEAVLHSETASRLQEMLAVEIDRLERMLGRDLEAWRSTEAAPDAPLDAREGPLVDV